MSVMTIVFLSALAICLAIVLVILHKRSSYEMIVENISGVINNTLADLMEDGAIIKNPSALSPRSVVRGLGSPRNEFAGLVLEICFYDKDHVKTSTLHNNLMRNREFLASSLKNKSLKGLDPYTSIQSRINSGNADMKSLLPSMALNVPRVKSYFGSPNSSDLSYLGAATVFSDGGSYDSSGGDGGDGGGGD